MPTSDAELVQRTLAGDREAFGDLIERHRRSVLALVIQKGFQLSEAEDVAQDVFIHAFRGLSTLKNRRAFEQWLIGITAHVSADWTRKRHRRRKEEKPLYHDTDLFGPPADRASLGLDEERERVFQALSELPEEQRVVITMRYLYGLSPKEVAERLGEPRGTIRSRLHHALTYLQMAFGISPLKKRRSGSPKQNAGKGSEEARSS